MNAKLTPIVADEIDPSAYDVLEVAPSVEIPASTLKAGMVLLDPMFGTPAAVIDHRMKAVRGSGAVALLVVDLETRNYAETSIRANKLVPVMAR